MLKGKGAIAPKSLQSYQNCEDFKKQLIQEIEVKNKRLAEISKLPKYTAEIKREKARLEDELKHDNFKLQQLEAMETVKVGDWVQKRFNHLVQNRYFPPGIRVAFGQLIGTTLDYPEDKPRGLIKVQVRLDSDEKNKPLVERSISPVELENLGHQDRLIAKKPELPPSSELEQLELIIAEGLETFYKVGEALLKICDRKLYKDLGYSNFREYCFERWNMSSRHAYRLIQSAEVLENVTNWSQNSDLAEKSVTHGSQNHLPQSERITRELAKLPPEKQAEAWSKAVETAPDNKPTAGITKEVVAEIINNNDNTSELLTENLI